GRGVGFCGGGEGWGGGALLDLGGDKLGGPAADALAESQRSPAGQAHGEGGQFGGAGKGASREVAHVSIVGQRAACVPPATGDPGAGWPVRVTLSRSAARPAAGRRLRTMCALPA